MNEVMTNHKENARMNQKSDMVIIGMKDNVVRNERIKDRWMDSKDKGSINGFKDE